MHGLFSCSCSRLTPDLVGYICSVCALSSVVRWFGGYLNIHTFEGFYISGKCGIPGTQVAGNIISISVTISWSHFCCKVSQVFLCCKKSSSCPFSQYHRSRRRVLLCNYIFHRADLYRRTGNVSCVLGYSKPITAANACVLAWGVNGPSHLHSVRKWGCIYQHMVHDKASTHTDSATHTHLATSISPPGLTMYSLWITVCFQLLLFRCGRSWVIHE